MECVNEMQATKVYLLQRTLLIYFFLNIIKG